MKELRKTEGGEGWGGGGVVWSLGDLYDEYGTMRAGSGTILGIASATMRLHVKEMPVAKRRHLASIMGSMSEDEDEGERSPDAKAPRIASPKVVIPAIEVSEGRGGTEVEVPKFVLTSEDNRGVGMAHPTGSGGTLAAATSKEHPPKETFDERGEFLWCKRHRRFLFSNSY